jgi:hypothetical protein
MRPTGATTGPAWLAEPLPIAGTGSTGSGGLEDKYGPLAPTRRTGVHKMCAVPVAIGACFRGERGVSHGGHRVVRVRPTGSSTSRTDIAELLAVAVTHPARAGGLEDKDRSLPLAGGTEFREMCTIPLAITTRFWRIHLDSPPDSV